MSPDAPHPCPLGNRSTQMNILTAWSKILIGKIDPSHEIGRRPTPWLQSDCAFLVPIFQLLSVLSCKNWENSTHSSSWLYAGNRRIDGERERNVEERERKGIRKRRTSRSVLHSVRVIWLKVRHAREDHSETVAYEAKPNGSDYCLNRSWISVVT